MNGEKILRDAIERYGVRTQFVVAIEEMSELQKELCKVLRTGAALRGWGTEHIAEEIADVEIMLDQMQIIFGLQDRVEQWRERKLERLEERIRGKIC